MNRLALNTAEPVRPPRPGVKLAWYSEDFTQFADNGKTVGNLNGAPSISHDVQYHSWLPSLDAHYLIQRTWSAYVQYATGSVIPPTSHAFAVWILLSTRLRARDRLASPMTRPRTAFFWLQRDLRRR